MAKGIRARLVLELLAKGMTGRETRPARHISQRSTGLAGEASERAGVTLGDVAGMPDREACDLLFPAQKEARGAYAEPGWEWVRPEPQRDGVTPGPLWEEHRDGAIRDGLAPEGHDTLRGGHRSYAGARGVTNHPGHKPGQVMEVDRDGTPMWPAGGEGEATKCHLLVATLPYSQHGYVEATPGMRQSTWPVCHARAWDFFGGVAAGTVCDNPETGVASHPRGGGVVPDEAHGALGTHHVTAIMPTGVRRPRQRAGVEGTCGKVATSIAARLRNRAFRTLAGPDDATREALGAPDPAPSRRREGSRKEASGEAGGAFLAPLPKMPSGVRWWACGRKVAPDPHVTSGRDHHPVPHACVGQRADLRAGDPAVEVWIAGGRVATHPRLGPHGRWPCRTGPPHMPPELAHAEWDDARMPRRSREAGPNTHAVASRVLADARMRGRGHDPALAVPDPSRRYGEEAQCHLLKLVAFTSAGRLRWAAQT